jgi:hypothetical protein
VEAASTAPVGATSASAAPASAATMQLDRDDVRARLPRRHRAGSNRRHRLRRPFGHRSECEQRGGRDAEATDRTTSRILRSDHRCFSCEYRHRKAHGQAGWPSDNCDRPEHERTDSNLNAA